MGLKGSKDHGFLVDNWLSIVGHRSWTVNRTMKSTWNYPSCCRRAIGEWCDFYSGFCREWRPKSCYDRQTSAKAMKAPTVSARPNKLTGRQSPGGINFQSTTLHQQVIQHTRGDSTHERPEPYQEQVVPQEVSESHNA